jgi:NADH-quinone oxidoreductase subunit K
VIGVAGFVFRRNIITVFMCIELMLNAVNLSFVAFANYHKQVSGTSFTFFVMVVAAAEAAVGLAIILTVFKNRTTLNIDEVVSCAGSHGSDAIRDPAAIDSTAL